MLHCCNFNCFISFLNEIKTHHAGSYFAKQWSNFGRNVNGSLDSKWNFVSTEKCRSIFSWKFHWFLAGWFGKKRLKVCSESMLLRVNGSMGFSCSVVAESAGSSTCCSPAFFSSESFCNSLAAVSAPSGDSGLSSIQMDYRLAGLSCRTSLFTSAEGEVKDSRRSGMYQSNNFWTRLGMQSL